MQLCASAIPPFALPLYRMAIFLSRYLISFQPSVHLSAVSVGMVPIVYFLIACKCCWPATPSLFLVT